VRITRLHSVALGALAIACGQVSQAPTEKPSEKDDVTLSAGAYHTCGLRSDGSLACWGDPADFGPDVAMPKGSYRALALARGYVCTIDANRNVGCAWVAENVGTGPIPTPSGEFLELAAAYWNTCGLRTDGHVVCWSDSTPPTDTAPDTEFSHIGVGVSLCGIPKSGQPSCGYAGMHITAARLTPFSGDLVSIANGWDLVCAIAKDGSAHCMDLNGVEQIHAGPFSMAGGGDGFGCGLRTTGHIECWGNAVAPPSGLYTTLAVGMTHVCVLDDAPKVTCWKATDAAWGTGDPPADFPVN
jgi:Regulator of chromosome condensation (RCC1) repeat